MADLTDANWRTSTHSGNGGDCVEVATNPRGTADAVLVRDSKDPTGAILTFAAEAWTAFTSGIRDDNFGQLDREGPDPTRCPPG